MPATAPTARLKARYLEEIRPELVRRFGYSTVMQAPRLEKITLNMGVGDARQDSKVLKSAQDQLATIAGQRPSVRRARKSIAAFKLREGMPVGVAVTLRAERGYEFLDRLTSIAIPRIRDFRGLSPQAFDGRGNYSMGVREQIIFPEIDYDAIDQVRGLDITITTTARTDAEAFALLQALGMPFAGQASSDGSEQRGAEGEGPAAVTAAPLDSEASSSAPVAEEAVEDESVAEEAVEDESVAEEAVEDESVAEEAVEDESVDQESVDQESAADAQGPGKSAERASTVEPESTAAESTGQKQSADEALPETTDQEEPPETTDKETAD